MDARITKYTRSGDGKYITVGGEADGWKFEVGYSVPVRGRASIWGRIKPFFTFFRLNKGSKCCTRGFPWGEQNAAQGVFWGRKRGFPGSPTLRSKKFRLRRQKSRLRRNLSILRANAAKQQVNFTMQTNATKKKSL